MTSPGDIVYVWPGRSSSGLPSRYGRVEQVVQRQGGALVRHDDGSLLGWSWRELQPMGLSQVEADWFREAVAR